MSQSEDIEAVNQFMIAQRSNTKDYPSLTKTLDSWDVWYSGLSWYEKDIDSSAWIRAKQYKQEVEGIYSTYKPVQPSLPDKPPVKPLIPDALKPKSITQGIAWTAYGVGALIGGLIILKAFRLRSV